MGILFQIFGLLKWKYYLKISSFGLGNCILLSVDEVKMDKIFRGDLPYFALNATILYKYMYCNNKLNVQMKHIS